MKSCNDDYDYVADEVCDLDNDDHEDNDYDDYPWGLRSFGDPEKVRMETLQWSSDAQELSVGTRYFVVAWQRRKNQGSKIAMLPGKFL